MHPSAQPPGYITETPSAFTSYVRANADKIQAATARGTAPYWVRDNAEYVNAAVSGDNAVAYLAEDPRHKRTQGVENNNNAAKQASISIPAGTLPVLDGANTTLTKIITDYEDKIRKRLDFEDAALFDMSGKTKLHRRGSMNKVELSEEDVAKMKNGILTHNHADGWKYAENDLRHIGSSFSQQDVTTAVMANVAELRAVTPNYTFSLQRPANGWGATAQDVREAYSRISAEIRREVNKAFANNEKTLERADAILEHLIMKRLAKEYGWVYRKRKTL